MQIGGCILLSLQDTSLTGRYAVLTGGYALRKPARTGSKYYALDDPCQALMKTAMRQLQLTARAYNRVLKLSRTIADLARSEAVAQVLLAEALQY